MHADSKPNELSYPNPYPNGNKYSDIEQDADPHANGNNNTRFYCDNDTHTVADQYTWWSRLFRSDGWRESRCAADGHYRFV